MCAIMCCYVLLCAWEHLPSMSNGAHMTSNGAHMTVVRHARHNVLLSACEHILSMSNGAHMTVSSRALWRTWLRRWAMAHICMCPHAGRTTSNGIVRVTHMNMREDTFICARMCDMTVDEQWGTYKYVLTHNEQWVIPHIWMCVRTHAYVRHCSST